MELQIINGAITLATKRMGGGHTQVGRPVIWQPGAPKGALRMATIKTEDKKIPVLGCAMRQKTGLPNPIAVFQRQANDRVRPQGAQAGGFWRSRRQRRKDV
ncbi:hypothetical protein BZL43_14265 [Pseudomonas sp. PICF141]|nr:hypothetical protein BZL43_14265 [Pseudomonas sp. PICF141]